MPLCHSIHRSLVSLKLPHELISRAVENHCSMRIRSAHAIGLPRVLGLRKPFQCAAFSTTVRAECGAQRRGYSGTRGRRALDTAGTLLQTESEENPDHTESEVNPDHTESEHNPEFEAALTDHESKKLYGVTPMLFELDQLANRFKKGTLNLAPNYQRGYVWKAERASRLVVTALCNRLIPGIVLHEKYKGKFEVVDGKQRLTTLLSFFLAGQNPELYKKLQLKTSSAFSCLSKLDDNYDSLSGLTYDQLSEDRRNALAAYTIPCTIIPLGTPKFEVFSCYEDINSGGEDLKAQQLRRAVFYGDYIKMLDRLANNKDFQAIFDPKAFRKGEYQLDAKESDRELILRAFAWKRSSAKFKRPLKAFLNDELQHYDTIANGDPDRYNTQLKAMEEEFKFVMKVMRNIFSEDDAAFRVWLQKTDSASRRAWSTSINLNLWDAMYLVLAELRHSFPKEPMYARRKNDIQTAVKKLFESNELDLSGTTTVAKFNQRCYVIRISLSEVMRASDGPVAKRAFPDHDGKLKRDLFTAQNGLCTICQNTIDETRISDGSYVHVDHVVPFSKGGASTHDNAALTHAACNQSKGASTEELG
jgi:hypothetical protein